MPRGLGERAEFYMNASYLFSKDLLAAITLIGYGAGERGRNRARAKCGVGLHLLNGCHLLRGVHLLCCWSRNPEGQVQAG